MLSVENYLKLFPSYFEFFCQRILINPNLTYNLTQRNRGIILNFMKIIQKDVFLESLSQEYWYDYFTFQFEYWRTKYTMKGRSQVYFHWVIGQEAWDRWVKKPEEWMYFVENGLLKLYNIDKSELIKEKQTNKVFNQSDYYKRLGKGSDNKLNFCITNNIYFDEKCQCKWGDLCRIRIEI